MNFIKLTEDEFDTEFKPVENLDQGQGNYHFDVYDSQDSYFLQFMSTNHLNHIWTRVDNENGPIFINGWHIVNRIDYMVTENPWKEHHEYEIIPYAP